MSVRQRKLLHPDFWSNNKVAGLLGSEGGIECVLLLLYLQTCPESHPTGLYVLDHDNARQRTQLTHNFYDVLDRLSETYKLVVVDPDSDWIFVKGMCVSNYGWPKIEVKSQKAVVQEHLKTVPEVLAEAWWHVYGSSYEITRRQIQLPVDKARPAVNYADGFKKFWDEYPKGYKINKMEAGEEYNKALAENIKHEAIMAGLSKWKGSDRWRDGYVNNPDKFIRSRMFLSDPPVRPKRPGESKELSNRPEPKVLT